MLTNGELWNYIRGKYPNFANQTSEATKDLFTERGFEQLRSFDSSILNDFFYLSMRVFLNKIDVAEVKDLLASQDFGETYDTPYGGYIQRLSVNSIKPISPRYKGLQNGDSPDPFVVRKPETNERFFVHNFDYASLITMPDTAMYKNMFIAEDGMARYAAGVMKGLQNGYTLQKYNNKMEALSAGIHSTDFPLKTSQEFECYLSLDHSETEPEYYNNEVSKEMIEFVKLIRNIVDAMCFTPATSMFNAYGFETTQDASRLRLITTPAIVNTLATVTRMNSPEDMSLPIPIVKVPDFGGLAPVLDDSDSSFEYPAGAIRVGETVDTPNYTSYKAATPTTEPVRLTGFDVDPDKSYMIYDDLGAEVCFAYKGRYTMSTDPVEPGEPQTGVLYLPNEYANWMSKYEDDNIVAIIADKGYIFEAQQNPYEVEPIRNPAGRYTNFWASSPENTIVVDHLYNCVVIRRHSEG